MIGREKHTYFDNSCKIQDSPSCKSKIHQANFLVSLIYPNCTSIKVFLNRAKVVSMVNPVDTQKQFFGERNSLFFL